jgi:cell division protein FtsQ
LALLALAYLGARQTSVFAVRSIDVSGAPEGVAASVRRVTSAFRGESLVALDRGELERRLLALPSVVSVRFDRAFPHSLRIAVTPERPVAVVRAGTRAWLVSARGRIVRALERGALPDLPRLWLPSAVVLAPGGVLGQDEHISAVRALARLPEGFPGTVAVARETEGAITLVLASRTELMLGDGNDLPRKLRVAAGILTSLSPGERATLRYLDVALPDRPVAST